MSSCIAAGVDDNAIDPYDIKTQNLETYIVVHKWSEGTTTGLKGF